METVNLSGGAGTGQLSRRYALSNYALKLIAVLFMFIDHTGVALRRAYGYEWAYYADVVPKLRGLGRTAFPIFAFLLLEGCRHTRNRTRYLVSLVVFGVLSELPFDLLNYTWQNRGRGMNIYFTLALGLAFVWTADGFSRLCREKRIPRGAETVCVLTLFLFFAGAGEVLQVDYNGMGVLLIALLYAAERGFPVWFAGQAEERFLLNVAACFGVLAWMAVYDYRQGALNELRGVACCVPLLLYSGERGHYRLSKWFFYAFYPVHLALLALFVYLQGGAVF